MPTASGSAMTARRTAPSTALAQNHSFGVRSTEKMIAVCAIPTGAQKRVASPTSRKAPMQASTTKVTDGKSTKFGSTTLSANHAYGARTPRFLRWPRSF
jgi:hypothetical protein